MGSSATPPAPVERRRRDREKYLVLRFYAKAVSGLSYASLVVGVLFGILVLFFGEQMAQPERVFNGVLSVLLGLVYFVFLQATAQVIYLLFDVAHNSKATRELLEKSGAPAAPKPVPGD